MIINFEAYKTLLTLSAKENYIFTSCSPSLINDVKEKSQNSDHIVFLHVSQSEINIEKNLDADNYFQNQYMYQNLLIVSMIKKLLELFPELEISIKDMLNYIYTPNININSISQNIYQSSFNDDKYQKIFFDIFTSLILRLKYINNIDVIINFYITDVVNTPLQHAINDFINEKLPFYVRIYTVFSNLSTYYQTSSKIINNIEKIVYSAKSITILPKTNKI